MRCANCGSELVGEYCHQCGQHVLEIPDFALSLLLRQFGRELIHLDFKTLHSLRALFAPGLLTREFLDGRRRRYLSPLKLYFVAAGIFFFAAPAVGFSLNEMLAQDTEGVLKNLVTARMQARSMDMPLFAERFDLRIQTVYTLSLSVSIFVAAAILRGLFPVRTFGAHLVFALHYVAFLYLVAIGLGALQKAFDLQSGVASIALTYAVLLPYLFFAMRRVYEQSAARTAWKVAVLCLVTFVVDNLVNFGALLLTLQLV